MAEEVERAVGDFEASFGIGSMARERETGHSGAARRGLAWPTCTRRRAAVRATVTELWQNPIYLAEKGISFERKQNPRKRVREWREKG